MLIGSDLLPTISMHVPRALTLLSFDPGVSLPIWADVAQETCFYS